MVRSPWLLLPLALALTGWNLPQYYQKLPDTRDRRAAITGVVVERNGERHLVAPGGILDFFAGDELRIVEAVTPRVLRQTRVNVVGLRPPRPQGRGENDLGHAIDTATFLTEPRWAVDAAGTTYAVLVTTPHRRLGYILLRRVPPRLDYVDIAVDTEPRVMRAGELLRVRGSDSFAVKKVVTNVPDLADVTFDVQATAPTPEQAAAQQAPYEIRFQYRAVEFAKIPVLIDQS